MARELETFLRTWDEEAARTVSLMRTLPAAQYDFRPYPKCRSLGELAWHLAELDGYISFGATGGNVSAGEKPTGLERPKTVAELATSYERVHHEAKARLAGLTDADLDRTFTFFDGKPIAIRTALWNALLHHMIHHRGQLALSCRLAGGTPVGIYGPNTEEMEAMRAARG